ncbi:puratrophin-1-like isoform X2 [Tachypleus tridentatus]|uniref:puratrophin-1-like isoform X2 n=1 Tax=Tachypleus tridentatus TaxID=6853 RepID=UPI003FD62789
MDSLRDIAGTATPAIGVLSSPESDEHLPILLQNLLIAIERGIERIEWEGVRNPKIYNHVCSGPTSNHLVDTKDISVQTSLLNLTSQNSNSDDKTRMEGDKTEDEVQSTVSSDIAENHCNNYQDFDSRGNCAKYSQTVQSNQCCLDVISFEDNVEPSSCTSKCADYEIHCSNICKKEEHQNFSSDPSQTMESQTYSSNLCQNFDNDNGEEQRYSDVLVLNNSEIDTLVIKPTSVPVKETTKLLSSTCKDKDLDDGYHDNALSHPTCISQVDPDLLHSGIAFLPGSRDVNGRSVVVVFCSMFRELQKVTATELARLLIYFYGVPRKEVVALGFCIVVDGQQSQASDWTTLDETFCLIEANIPNAISNIVVYTNLKPEDVPLFPVSGFKYESVTAVETLRTFVKRDQLLPEHSGYYRYDHQEWISFRRFLEPFITGCQLSGRHLVSIMQELRGSKLPSTAMQTSQLIERQKKLINQAFQNEHLRHLVDEGDTVLKELESYGSKTSCNPDYRDCLTKGSSLHSELKKATAKLAKLADQRLKKLEQFLQTKTFEEEAHQRQLEKGNDLLEEVVTLKPRVSEEFAGLHEDKGQSGVQELASSLKESLNTFTERLEDTRERLEDTAKCYHLLDRSYEWALEAMKFVSKMKVNQPTSPGVVTLLKSVQEYLEDHPPITYETFQEMLKLSTKLENKNLLDQCKIAQTRCQETMDLIQTRRASLLKAKQQQELETLQQQQELSDSDAEQSNQTNFQQQNWIPHCTSTCSGSFTTSSGFYRRRSIATSTPQSYGCPVGSYTSFPSSYHPVSGLKDTHVGNDKEEHILNQGLITEDLTTQGPVASISRSKLEARSNSLQKEIQPFGIFKSYSGSSLFGLKDKIIGTIVAGAASIQNSSKEGPSHHRPLRKLMKRCQTWQLHEDSPQRALSEVRAQNEKFSIHQASVQSIGSEDSTSSCGIKTDEPIGLSNMNRPPVGHTLSDPGNIPVPVNSHLLARTTSLDQSKLKDLEQQKKGKKLLLHIMREMIQTEKDYVKSLEFIIENYLPELLREDIPQALRGQRNVIFGNIEKIYEFHNHYFLSQLEKCENLPFLVGQCFLIYESQFYLYALYNKNKPKSESLLVEYGNTFFKKKQLELGDKMDLASYLLKPVQRMGKYALLLKQLLKECPQHEPEHEDLKAAEEMVRFQLRHGNDLLAMDALRECDVNLKEQGRLLRQDEFLVWQGRSRKCLRRIFLFEDLVLFSKTRRDPHQKGQEIYQYKLSFKTTDIGMTEEVGGSPTKFEVWFRKRKLSDTFVLQASSPEVKQAWILEISKLLWKQALKNREMRLAEMSSMGIGSKPCLDIKPNEDQISDRAINFQSLGRALRFRNSFTGSSFDQSHNNKRPCSTISVSSSSSSGSSNTSFLQYGSLNLGFEPGDSPFPAGYRSVTQQSQCSTESGFSTDPSLAGDSCGESERPRHKKAERSDSLLSNDSVITHFPISEHPSTEDQLQEETETTSM